ncbi:MAG TPA: hypothetical protein EYQ00_09385 [Dehalococcoidia bacterium]|jgi:hypothetical protein|nr:hypothetical protein [Dehalococcoidia bacterium]
MTTNELERLIAMLEPNADANAVDFVRRELTKVCVPFTPSLDAEINTESQAHVDDDWSCTSQGELEMRSNDPFNNWPQWAPFPNDPRNW